MKKSTQEEYNELASYTLSLNDSAFIHQYAVDAFAAQTADEHTKPIKIAFALIGLYLHLEKGFTGKKVQVAHMKMAKSRKAWPIFVLPAEKGKIAISDVLAASPGNNRDKMIDVWCASVWKAYGPCRNEVAELVRQELFRK